jgi:transcription elongation factor Elf1
MTPHTCDTNALQTCFRCLACKAHRVQHPVAVKGVVRNVLRCTHCDGPDAHTTIRKNKP